MFFFYVRSRALDVSEGQAFEPFNMEEYCRVVKLDLNCFWPGGNKRVGHTLFYLNVIYLPLISICVPLSVISCSSVYVYMFVFCFVVTPSWEFVSPWVFFFSTYIFNLCSIYQISTALCLAVVLSFLFSF